MHHSFRRIHNVPTVVHFLRLLLLSAQSRNMLPTQSAARSTSFHRHYMYKETSSSVFLSLPPLHTSSPLSPCPPCPSLPPSPSLPVEGFIVLQSQLHQSAPNQNVRLENCRLANSHSFQMRSLLPSRSFKSYIGCSSACIKTTDKFIPLIPESDICLSSACIKPTV